MFSSIKTKLLLLVSSLLFLAISIVSGFLYLSSLKRIENGLGEKALSIARTAAITINGDNHSKLSQNISNAGGMEELATLQKKLRMVKNTNSLQTDVYTYTRAWWVNDTDNIVFVGSSSEETFSVKGQAMEAYMKKALYDGSSGFTEIFKTVNGEWITGYSPIYSSDGNISGVLEVALATSDEVLTARNQFLKNVVISAIVAMILGCIFTYIVATKTTSPIIALGHVTRSMAGGDLNTRAEVSGKDEITSLSKDFNKMAENLEKSYRELEIYNEDLEKMVEARTAEVVASKKKIQKILAHIEQGILTFDKSLRIDDEFSAYLSEFYNVASIDIPGRDVLELVLPESNLTSDQYNQAHETLKAVVGEHAVAWTFNSDHLPTEATIKIAQSEKIIGLEWTPIFDNSEKTERLMLAMKDLTAQRMLEKEVAEKDAKNQELMDKIGELVTIERDRANKFFVDSDPRVKSIEKSSSNHSLDKLFMEIHTLKGGARLLNFKGLIDVAHKLEKDLQDYKEGKIDEELTIKNGAKKVSDKYYEYRRVFKDVLGGSSNVSTSHENTGGFYTLIDKHVFSIKEDLIDKGLELGEISVFDAVVSWKSEVLPLLDDILIHSFSNSIDHGYHRPFLSGSKVSPISLSISAETDKNRVIIKIKDEGSGLDRDKVVKLAAGKNIDCDESSDASVFGCLFHVSFSTADTVSTSSGRGVGLPAIKDMVNKLDGEVSIGNGSPTGTILTIDFPQTKVCNMYGRQSLKKAV
ncbi:MAG: HAMP domain-containing protein [Pseudobacteriovorax sp.]|nr:HAMP domain-containing protein [Pseudobacteriovorax sp.]